MMSCAALSRRLIDFIMDFAGRAAEEKHPPHGPPHFFLHPPPNSSTTVNGAGVRALCCAKNKNCWPPAVTSAPRVIAACAPKRLLGTPAWTVLSEVTPTAIT